MKSLLMVTSLLKKSFRTSLKEHLDQRKTSCLGKTNPLQICSLNNKVRFYRAERSEQTLCRFIYCKHFTDRSDGGAVLSFLAAAEPGRYGLRDLSRRRRCVTVDGNRGFFPGNGDQALVVKEKQSEKYGEQLEFLLKNGSPAKKRAKSLRNPYNTTLKNRSTAF